MHRAPAENFTVASLAAMQVPQLKELCQQRGMPIKARMVGRCSSTALEANWQRGGRGLRGAVTSAPEAVCARFASFRQL